LAAAGDAHRRVCKHADCPVTGGVLCRVPQGTVDVVLSYCHNSLHDTSLLKVRQYSSLSNSSLKHTEGVCQSCTSAFFVSSDCFKAWQPPGPRPACHCHFWNLRQGASEGPLNVSVLCVFCCLLGCSCCPTSTTRVSVSSAQHPSAWVCGALRWVLKCAPSGPAAEVAPSQLAAVQFRVCWLLVHTVTLQAPQALHSVATAVVLVSNSLATCAFSDGLLVSSTPHPHPFPPGS
jgi:hypothetical protein